VTGDIFDVDFTAGPVRVIWAVGTSNSFGYHGLGTQNRGTTILDLYDDDVCGHTSGCAACAKQTTCVFCSGDNLCYLKTNTGNCTPLSTTC